MVWSWHDEISAWHSLDGGGVDLGWWSMAMTWGGLDGGLIWVYGVGWSRFVCVCLVWVDLGCGLIGYVWRRGDMEIMACWLVFVAGWVWVVASCWFGFKWMVVQRKRHQWRETERWGRTERESSSFFFFFSWERGRVVLENKSWDVRNIVKWYDIIDKVVFWDDKIVFWDDKIR